MKLHHVTFLLCCYSVNCGVIAYENADFLGLMNKALEAADWDGFPLRRARSEQCGLLRGRGLSTVIENTSPGNFPRDEQLPWLC